MYHRGIRWCIRKAIPILLWVWLSTEMIVCIVVFYPASLVNCSRYFLSLLNALSHLVWRFSSQSTCLSYRCLWKKGCCFLSRYSNCNVLIGWCTRMTGSQKLSVKESCTFCCSKWVLSIKTRTVRVLYLVVHYPLKPDFRLRSTQPRLASFLRIILSEW